MTDEYNNKDLPLMANANDIAVFHYIFELTCNFEEKYFDGSVIIHLSSQSGDICTCHMSSTKTLASEASSSSKSLNKEFVCILDCCDVIVNNVHEIDITNGNFKASKFSGSKAQFLIKSPLPFCIDNWSLRIWKPEIFCPCCFPKFLKISYQTKSCGQSLMWVKDQDGKPVVYTYGAWINNRSLFPCQEPPNAMATWEAFISVAEPAIVLMSGDNKPVFTSQHGISTCYYYTRMLLPMATLALAVGFWHVEDRFEWKPEEIDVNIRICAAPSLLPMVVKEMSQYIFKSVKAAEELFGKYPFPRIDFLIVPRGFASLGMASPNIIFLSRSLLAGDGSMCCRIAHEVSHAWFGLLIGASDWTEEWLSEGFATYCEDLVHTKSVGLETKEALEYQELRAYLRSKTLTAEMENTDEDLHLLRPNKGEAVIQTINNADVIILKNGQNPEKGFMQVHYIKGYFLLKHLSDVVGQSPFVELLRTYIQKYRGKLVDSMEMLELFVSTFPAACLQNSVTLEKIASEWLHSSEIPAAVLSFSTPPSNNLFNIVKSEVTKWRELNRKCLSKRNSKRRKYDLDQFSQLSVDSMIILLDFLLEEKFLTPTVLRLISEVYRVSASNAEICHKWCELVVKHRYYAGYHDVEKFLTNDLAMGVYLYGELILNGTKSQKEFAQKCFKRIEEEVEPNTRTVVMQMFDTSEEENPAKVPSD